MGGLTFHVVTDDYRAYKIFQQHQNSSCASIDLTNDEIACSEKAKKTLGKIMQLYGGEKYLRKYDVLSILKACLLNEEIEHLFLKGEDEEDFEEALNIIYDNMSAVKPHIHFISKDEFALPIEFRMMCEVIRYPPSYPEERREIFEEHGVRSEKVVKLTDGLTLPEVKTLARLLARGVSLKKALYELKTYKLREFGVEILEGGEKLSETNLINPRLKQKIFDILDSHEKVSILLAGPPGSGKSFLAKLIANELEGPSIVMNSSKLVESLSRGRLRRALDRVVIDAIEDVKPSGVIIDQFDVLSAKYSLEHAVIMDKILAWLEGRKRGVLIGTTTKIQEIDPQLIRPGRFDYVILMPLPDYETRARILAYHGVPEDEASFLAMKYREYWPADLSIIAKHRDIHKQNPEYGKKLWEEYKAMIDYVSKLPHGIVFRRRRARAWPM